jgi:hypothetical protein
MENVKDNSFVSQGRLEQITGALNCVSNSTLRNLEDLVENAKVNAQISTDGFENLNEESIYLDSINKSFPYVEIKKNVELDSNNEPCISYSIIMQGVYESTKDTYIGTFGKEEMLKAIQSLTQSKSQTFAETNKIPKTQNNEKSKKKDEFPSIA